MTEQYLADEFVESVRSEHGTDQEVEEYLADLLGEDIRAPLAAALRRLNRRDGARLLRILARLRRREVVAPARAALRVADKSQYEYAEVLACMGEDVGFKVLAKIYRRNSRLAEPFIPPNWILDALEDIGTPRARQLAERLAAGE